jgi:hypothetical protein
VPDLYDQGRYRELKLFWRYVSVRFDLETATEIEKFAKDRRIKRAEAVRLLVQWGLEEHKHGEAR